MTKKYDKIKGGNGGTYKVEGGTANGRRICFVHH